MNGNSNGKKKRRRRIIYGIVITVVLLVVVGGVIAATSGGTKIDPTKLAKVEKGDLAKSVVATGKVTPITKVEVKSKASGIVKKLLVDAGDRVKKGQLLAQLDKDEIQAQVEQSHAALEAAQASSTSSQADYERAKVDAEGVEIPMLKRAYERAQGMAKEGSHIWARVMLGWLGGLICAMPSSPEMPWQTGSFCDSQVRSLHSLSSGIPESR